MHQFRKQRTIDIILQRSLEKKIWRSACIKEAEAWLTFGEKRADLETYIKKAYDAAGAGFSGRWQE